MTMNPLPPQAYTKDTLLKAYQWLMTQNSSIKEIATNPDILVSLYLKATRDGDHALDRPSIQNFKNELRSLAGMMGDLERPVPPMGQAMPMHQQHQHQPQVQVQVQVPHQHQQVHQSSPVHHYQAPIAHAASAAAAAAQSAVMTTTTTSVAVTGPAPSSLADLDECTMEMIQEVKNDFNLSSDKEALRMLIKIGHTRAKAMLKS
jgi:hypothetical protein